MPVEQEPVPSPAPADGSGHHAPIPSPRPDDLESGILKDIKPSSGRASLPSRPSSMHSHRTDLAPGTDAEDTASEFPWGPQHPCFPHPNPHVPKDSPLYHTTRIIRINRDWMVKGDLAPTFANLYPEILDPVIPEDDFRAIVKRINDTLIDAFDPLSFRSWLDSVMGVATFWLWDDAGLTKVKKQLGALERWIDDWNKDVGEKEGVKIIPLRRTGYLTLDIQIPDPHFENITGSRPNTQQDDLHSAAPQEHGDFGSYPIAPPPPALQVSAGSPVEAQS
ncbi:hypothetical protein K491DRAFT_714435 [Lophiostoma macrostomum CBS 122681]|uniref:Ras modification protein ERF4 n=1 Tax=Lophiostoma macrostomum CBS 122681 TaxID=1314788 RepID=A0A6A6TDK5_9PLEO|nr:hypothetical protein K491DRAFT_714435 [Lophiostoma macrostomum CBS 122681]